MTDKQRDLKPCPMCGGPAIFEINDSTDTRYGLDSVRVECAGCGVQTEHEFSDNPFNKDDCEKARDRAAEAWNNRATQSAGEVEADELLKFISKHESLGEEIQSILSENLECLYECDASQPPKAVPEKITDLGQLPSYINDNTWTARSAYMAGWNDCRVAMLGNQESKE